MYLFHLCPQNTSLQQVNMTSGPIASATNLGHIPSSFSERLQIKRPTIVVARIVIISLVVGFLIMVTNLSITLMELISGRVETIWTVKGVDCAPPRKEESGLDERQQMQDILHSLRSSPPGKAQHFWPVK